MRTRYKSLILGSLIAPMINTAFAQCGEILFEDDFETGAFGPRWTAIPEETGANGRVDVWFNGSDYDVRMGKSADAGGLTLNSLDLHIGDLLEEHAGQDIDLYFQIRSYYDETQTDEGLWLSDGIDTVKVLDFRSGDWHQNEFGAFPPISISRLAEAYGIQLNSNFVIRWRQQGTGDFSSNGTDRDGFYLDNVRVCVQNTQYAPIPFCDGFEEAVLNPAWRQVFTNNYLCPGIGQIVPFETTTGNTTMIFERARRAAEGYESAFRFEIGRVQPDPPGAGAPLYTAAAADLHLDLGGYEAVALSYAIYSNDAETNPEDAIYLSVDGGDTFVKIFELKESQWEQLTWGRFPPLRLDIAAARHGLTLSSQTVIRFQQMVSANFGAVGGRDGIRLDNVCVQPVNIAPVQLPYCQDFEGLQTFPAGWFWVDADSTILPATDAQSICDGVRVVSSGGNNSLYAARLGRTCEVGGLRGTALDLHVDLEGSVDLALSFALKDFYSEVHPQDAIWFSDDGGVTWGGSYWLNMADFPDNAYKSVTINLDSMLTALGLTASADFVIRFQEYDDADFNTAGDEDGYFLDNVCISGSGVGVTQVRKYDGFTLRPNPTSGFVFLDLADGMQPRHLTVFDATGRVVLAQPIANTSGPITVDLTGHESGLYLVQVQLADGTRLTERVVKE